MNIVNMTIPVPSAFLTGAPGPGELILLFLVILVLFGPRRLPEVARKIGKMLDQLRRASQDFRDQIMHIEESTAVDVSSVDAEQDHEEQGHEDESTEPYDEEAVDADPGKGETEKEEQREGAEDKEKKNDLAG